MDTERILDPVTRTQTVAHNLRAFRLTKAMSLQDVSTQTGLSLGRLQRAEAGFVTLSASDLLHVSRCLGCTVADFFTPRAKLPPGVRPVDDWFAKNILPHAKLYYGTAYRLTRDTEAANDLVQDAYAQILNYGAWDAIDHPRAFMLKMINNLGRTRIRRHKVVIFQGLPEFDTLQFSSDEPDSFTALSARQQLARAVSILKSLPATTRYVMSLRRLEQLPVKDIAARLGITVKGVEYHVTRGSYLLAKALEDENAKPVKHGDKSGPNKTR